MLLFLSLGEGVMDGDIWIGIFISAFIVIIGGLGYFIGACDICEDFGGKMTKGDCVVVVSE